MPENDSTTWITVKPEDIKVGDEVKVVEKYDVSTVTYEGPVQLAPEPGDPVFYIGDDKAQHGVWAEPRGNVEVELYRKAPPLPTTPGSAVLFYSLEYQQNRIAHLSYLVGVWRLVGGSEDNRLSEVEIQQNLVKVLHDAGA